MILGVVKLHLCSICNNRYVCLPEEDFPTLSIAKEQFTHRPFLLFLEDEYIYKEGDKAGVIYCVYSGKVKIFSENKTSVIAKDGDYIGYNSIVNGLYTNSAIALEYASCCEISIAEAQQLIDSHKPVAEKILEGY